MTMPMRAPPAPGGQSSRPAENVPTQLLTPEENQRLFRLLGERCQTLATAVVQLYCSSPPTHTSWIRHDTGIICFVRDNSRRAYFLQLYSSDARVWEQELYQNFQYSRTRNFFHTFEAHDCRAGLNFAEESEADQFGRRVEDHLRNKQLKKEQRYRSRQLAESRHSNGTVPRSATLPQQRPVAAQHNDRSAVRGRQKKSKLSKADIGLPTNFQHISHVGWDPHKGFDLENVDPKLKQFFNKAGVSDTQLQDQDTRQFIYDFIDQHGGVEAAIKEVHQLGGAAGVTPGPPPPVPTRQPPASGRPVAPPAPPVRSTPPLTHSGAAPPPPPSRTRQAPPQPPAAAAKPGVPAPPPPPTPNSAPPPPPPPPPPPAGVPAPPPPPPPPSAAAKPGGGLPAVSDSRSQLMDSIRAGTTLRPVGATTDGGGNSSGGGRDDLMAQIRGGATLRHVTDKPAPPPASSEAAPPGLAGALARALADRKRVIHSSDEDDEDEEEEDDDDEWED